MSPHSFISVCVCVWIERQLEVTIDVHCRWDWPLARISQLGSVNWIWTGLKCVHIGSMVQSLVVASPSKCCSKCYPKNRRLRRTYPHYLAPTTIWFVLNSLLRTLCWHAIILARIYPIPELRKHVMYDGHTVPLSYESGSCCPGTVIIRQSVMRRMHAHIALVHI